MMLSQNNYKDKSNENIIYQINNKNNNNNELNKSGGSLLNSANGC